MLRFLLVTQLVLLSTAPAIAQRSAWKLPNQTTGDRMLAEYFQQETQRITDACLANIKTADDWNREKDKYRQQLHEMLGLAPLPERTDLEATITGTLEHDDVLVDRLHFQSSPGLYVTGNLYRAKGVTEKRPAVLYVCGHGRVKKDGISYGNKTHYHHHGLWFARNGYVCLTIDTIQLGEIEGMHHGTYRHGKWWWHSRGYTPAGVEAWNGIRAIDYLQSRDDVDENRIGITGRSGGGAYSWWVAALDERVKCAVPVAGITSMYNHVVDGCIEGHCDCMFQVNTYEWDYPMLAALVAPRPLLISNTDKDSIFPLDGVVDVYSKTRRIYDLLGASKNIGLHITEGPHSDTQELRIHAFRWLNRFLRDSDELITVAANKELQPEQLKVFEDNPTDELVTTVDELFVPQSETELPATKAEWTKQRDAALAALREHSFRGWPDEKVDLNAKPVFDVTRAGTRFTAWDFDSQHPFRLRYYLAHPAKTKAADLDLVVLNVVGNEGWEEFVAIMNSEFSNELKDTGISSTAKDDFESQRKMFERFNWGMSWVAPRGIGPTAWSGDERKQIQIRRRFALLGQTISGQRVWDVCQAVRLVQSKVAGPKLWLQASGDEAAVSLYAALFSQGISRLDLHDLPESHRSGPQFLNIARSMSMNQALAIAAERVKVALYTSPNAWDAAVEIDRKLGWNRLQIRKPLTSEE